MSRQINWGGFPNEKRNFISVKNISIIFFIAIICLGLGWGCYEINCGNERNFVATVTEKYIKRQNDHDVYMIVLQRSDGIIETVTNQDSPVFMKFNSSDVYARLQPGHKYNIKTAGYRSNFPTIYPNLISAEKVND